jgi:hypothetical protein
MTTTITEFLTAFYPDEHEPIRFRGFAPKKYPKWNQEGAKPFGYINSAEFTVTRSALATDKGLQSQIVECNKHRGMYFIVNSGISEAKRLPIGQLAKPENKKTGAPTEYVRDQDIMRFNAFFAEDDERSIQEQLARIERCPLLPSLMIVTLKSVHCYWLCGESVTVAEWREIQGRLIAYFGGDESIKNPSRVMRLPKLNHVSYDPDTQQLSYKVVEFYRFEPSERFTLEAMRAAFPAVPEKPKADYQPTADPGEYPTWQVLGDELRRRMGLHPTAHKQGDKIVLQGVCHEGKGNSALFFNTVTGKYHCDAGCKKEDLLRAFGLPERPTNWQVEYVNSRRITPQTAKAVQITDKKWTDNPALVGLVERLKAQAALASPSVLPVAQGNEVAAQSQSASELPASCGRRFHHIQPIATVDHCEDCGEFGRLYGRLCAACSELRGFLDDPLRCGHSDARRWRHPARTVDGERVPPGFKWHCETCRSAPGDAVWDRARSAA